MDILINQRSLPLLFCPPIYGKHRISNKNLSRCLQRIPSALQSLQRRFFAGLIFGLSPVQKEIPRRQFVPITAKGLPNNPFEIIPPHRKGYGFFGNNEGQAGKSPGMILGPNPKILFLKKFRRGKEGTDDFGLIQSEFFLESMGSNQVIKLFLRNDLGQTLPPFGTASLDDVLSRFSLHTISKAVLAFRLGFTGLKGAFHFYFLAVFCLLNFLKFRGENTFIFFSQREKKSSSRPIRYDCVKKKSCQRSTIQTTYALRLSKNFCIKRTGSLELNFSRGGHV